MAAEATRARLRGLPGAELIAQGLADLAAGVESIPGLLVAVGAHRIAEKMPEVKLQDLPERPERRLYALLGERFPREAYSQYNAHLRRLSSFCRALESARKPRASA